MTRTYVDAGVLIAAATGRHPDVQPVALAILDDEERRFVSSVFLRLEVEPKAIHGGRELESAFYEAFFDAVETWADPVAVVDLAFRQAAQHGLNALDALHVAAAISLGADNLVTTERRRSPIFRVTAVKVTSILPDRTLDRV